MSVDQAAGPVLASAVAIAPPRSGLGRRLALFATLAIVAYLVLAPLVFLLYGSFFTGSPGEAGTLSLAKYAEVFSSLRTYRLLGLSVLYAGGATAVAFFFGTLIAWFVQRTDLPGKGFFTFATMFPIFTPPVLAAIAWQLVLDPNVGLVNKLTTTLGMGALFNANSFLGMIWVGGMLEVPLVFLWLWPAFAAMDPSLEEAAAMCRGNPFKVIRTVTLPIAWPALAAVFLISFVLCIEDVTVPIVIGLPSGINVFATEIYIAYARVPTDLHAASVYSIMLLAITVLLMMLYRRVTAGSGRYVTVRGKAFRPHVFPLGRARLPVTLGLALIMVIIVGLPVFVLAWTAFSPFLSAPSWAGLKLFSLRQFMALLADPMALRGIINTTILGFGAAAVVIGLAIVIGWFQLRTKLRGRALLDVLSFLPIAIPGLVVGIALMWLYLILPVPVYGTLWIIGIAFVTRFLPYGARLTYAAFSQIHAELEEAALVSGSGWFRTMRTITLPLLAPTLVVGVIYTVLRAFRELPASLMLASFGNESYSVVAYHMWDGGEPAKAAAYGIVAMALMSVIVIVAQWLTGRRNPTE